MKGTLTNGHSMTEKLVRELYFFRHTHNKTRGEKGKTEKWKTEGCYGYILIKI